MSIPFDNSYARLPARFYARLHPANVPTPQLVRINDALAASLHIDPEWLASTEGIAMLSGNVVVEGSEPLAQAYAGHQFGGWVPQLGDGRALLLGEVVDRTGVRRDIQLKGSGQTPFSRAGDGKSALGPVLREYLVSEAMYALGVPTTRALAAVTTGEQVARETMLAGGVFTRVASSHLRVGTFQYFYAREDRDALTTLANYAIERHYLAAAEAERPVQALIGEVVTAQAKLVAHWMSLGFIHGVMNTDNTTISGETIDYGPCAFMDTFHPECVFSSIDRNARYAWGNQAMIAHWNLVRFAETLLPILDDEPERAKELAEEKLGAFADTFTAEYHAHFYRKLGLADDAPESFIRDTLTLLQAHEVDFTLFFRKLTQLAAGETIDIGAWIDEPSAFETWRADWESHRDPTNGVAAMQSANPVLIPRNHQIERAIAAGYDGDLALFQRLCRAWQNPYVADPEFTDLEAPPLPHEIVRETFCGT